MVNERHDVYTMSESRYCPSPKGNKMAECVTLGHFSLFPLANVGAASVE